MTNDIEAAADLSCPFCREPDFDAVGLKAHLSSGHCEAYDSTPSPARTVRLGSPALAHAARGEGDAPKPRVVVAGPAVRAMGAIIDKMRGNPSSPPRPPATGEADPEPRGEDREAVEAARGEDVGERQRFLAWWHGHDATDYAAFPGENTKCVAYAAWCGRARALRAAERGEGAK